MPMRQLADGTWYNTDNVPPGFLNSNPALGDPNLQFGDFTPLPWDGVHSDFYNNVITDGRTAPGEALGDPFQRSRRRVGISSAVNQYSPEEIMRFLASEESLGIGDEGRAYLMRLVAGNGQTGLQNFQDALPGFYPSSSTGTPALPGEAATNTPPERQGPYAPPFAETFDGPQVVGVDTSGEGQTGGVRGVDVQRGTGFPNGIVPTPVGVENNDPNSVPPTQIPPQIDPNQEVYNAVMSGEIPYGYTDQGLVLSDPYAEMQTDPLIVSGDQVEAVYSLFVDPNTNQRLQSFVQLANMYGYETAYALITEWLAGNANPGSIFAPQPDYPQWPVPTQQTPPPPQNAPPAPSDNRQPNQPY